MHDSKVGVLYGQSYRALENVVLFKYETSSLKDNAVINDCCVNKYSAIKPLGKVGGDYYYNH